MMKRLLLLRHGKSDWNAAHGADHDRPINDRGQRAAADVGRFLSRIDHVPDRIVSSSALRARDTARRAAAAGGWSTRIELTRDLYGTTPEGVLAIARGTDDAVGTLLLAGHEPTSSATVELLTGARVRFPTAAVACIRFVGSWRDLAAGEGELIFLLPPKHILL